MRRRAPEDLRQFLARLRRRDDLATIAVAVDPELEIAAVTDRVCKGAAQGRALRFEQPAGYDFPILTNLFGSEARIAAALGAATLADLSTRLAQALAPLSGPAVARLVQLTSAWAPRDVAAPPCREVREQSPDLRRIPALRSWPGDGGRYLTLPLVFCRDADSGESNCGMYRVQLLGAREAAIHLGPRSGAGRHLQSWHRRGQAMPVAIALGGPPALTWAAGAPFPAEVDEAALAGWLLGRPLGVTMATEGGLAVPAAAEVVIEGYLEPGETSPEGPFGNHTGYYVPAAPQPRLRVTGISRRRRPLIPATVVGPPPMEDCWLARATERLFLPLLQIDHPEILDLHLPLETIFHGCALIRVAAPTPARVRALAAALGRSPWLGGSRLLAFFGEDVDVRDPAQAWWRAVNHVDSERDLVPGADRLVIDATRAPRRLPVRPDPGTEGKVSRRWQSYGLD